MEVEPGPVKIPIPLPVAIRNPTQCPLGPSNWGWRWFSFDRAREALLSACGLSRQYVEELRQIFEGIRPVTASVDLDPAHYFGNRFHDGLVSPALRRALHCAYPKTRNVVRRRRHEAGSSMRRYYDRLEC